MPDRAGAVLSEPLPKAHDPALVVGPLLQWAEPNLRDLPWRRTRDPWQVLVSEVMLQQTQVSRVIPKWRAFIDRFPTPTACAGEPAGEVIALWGGLGYNRRGLNLWRAAGEICARFGGEVPRDIAALQSLPGIGPYTARAVSVFAFEQHVGVVDTNVGRLLARWTGEALTTKAAQRLADELVPDGNAWLWNQALFDFANAVCTKRSPLCSACDLAAFCAYAGNGDDPAVGSAGVAKRQSRFEGSVRQVRGRLLDALRNGPIEVSELGAFARPDAPDGETEQIVEALIDEGLVVREKKRLRLP